jgi:hypothetical protein
MVELNNHIRLYADLPQHDLKIENLGVGGRTQIAKIETSSSEIASIDAGIAMLSTRVSVELENYKTLLNFVGKNDFTSLIKQFKTTVFPVFLANPIIEITFLPIISSESCMKSSYNSFCRINSFTI